MSSPPPSHPHRIIILGAGFGGLYAFRRLHHFFHHDPNVQLVLVNRENYFLFTPLLHEVATGGISPEDVLMPIRRAMRCCLTEFHLADVHSLHPKEQTVETNIGMIPYDHLVIALGSKTCFFNVPGAEKYCFTLKSYGDALKLKHHVIYQFERASETQDRKKRKHLLHFVVVGGGPTGVEYAAELAEFVQRTFAKFYCHHIQEDVCITLVQRDSELLPQFSPMIRRVALRLLRKKGIHIKLNTQVKNVSPESLLLSNEQTLESETIVWVAGIEPSPLVCDIPMPRDEHGRLLVDAGLRWMPYPNIFGIGDIACFKGNERPLPALAQVATKQAVFVADQIRRDIRGEKSHIFHYKHRGDLISLGRGIAAADIGPFKFHGNFAWWLWRSVYLSKFLSWPKTFEVTLDWIIDIFSPRDISIAE